MLRWLKVRLAYRRIRKEIGRPPRDKALLDAWMERRADLFMQEFKTPEDVKAALEYDVAHLEEWTPR